MNSTTSRLQFIDGLRGIAVMMVVVFHAVVWGGFPIEGNKLSYLFDGAIPIELGSFRHLISVGGGGVDLFLAISGFCLFWPLVKNGGVISATMQIWPYIKRRTRRIMPPYYCALALVLLCSYFTYRFQGDSWWPWYPNSFQNAFPWQGIDAWFNLTSHLLLIHGFFNSYVSSYEAAYWSLSLEWQFYFAFIPLAFIARRFGVLWAALVPIVATAIYILIGATVAPFLLAGVLGFTFFPSRWAEFGAGMLAAAIVSGSLPPRLVQAFEPVKRLKFLYAALSVATALICEYLRTPFVLPFVWGNASLAILVCGAQSPFFHRVLEWRPLAWLGTISYSLYLTHGMVYMAMATLLSRTEMTRDVRQLLYLFGGPLIAIAFAALFFQCFEKPFLRHILVQGENQSQHLKSPDVQTTVQDQAAP